MRGKWWRLGDQYRSDFHLRIIAGEVAGTIFVSSGVECNVAIGRNMEGMRISVDGCACKLLIVIARGSNLQFSTVHQKVLSRILHALETELAGLGKSKVKFRCSNCEREEKKRKIEMYLNKRVINTSAEIVT